MTSADRGGTGQGTPIRRGVYPGSFSPATVAHLHIAAAARAQRRLDRIDLVISEVALAKETVAGPSAEERAERLAALVGPLEWLAVRVTAAQLLVDIAGGYDVLVLGADKWHQLHDPAFYGNSEQRRDDALARLPEVAVAPRPPWTAPARRRLRLPPHLAPVSSTKVRAGAVELAATAATVAQLRDDPA